MSVAALQRYGARRGVIAVLALLGTVNSAFASPGCDAVNAGAWNGFMNSSTVGISNFAVGDKIQIQATAGGSSQILELVGFANFGNTVVAQTALSGTINYTVTGTNDDTDLYLAIGTGTTFTATITATCNLQSSSSSDALAAVKGFLLSRINGMLLNEPTNMSVLNRSLATSTPMTTAMANGAMNVASRGGAFGASTTGVGPGLGNAMGLGGAGPGDADIGAD